jgi:hypothetical protein
VLKRLLQEHVRPNQVDKAKGFFTFIFDALLARRGFVAYIPIAFLMFAIFCGSSWQIFLPNTDAARYQCYALTFWLGSTGTLILPAPQCAFLHITSMQPPLHLLPIEYPPLTLLPFSLALLAPLMYYQLVFALLMSLTAILIYALLLRYGPRGAGFIFALYMFVGALGTAQTRFDLLPSALTLLCIIAAERRHWTPAYIALAFAVLLKLYPILLLPVLFLAEQQTEKRLSVPSHTVTLKSTLHDLWEALRRMHSWRWKNSMLFVGIIVGITGFFALFNFAEGTFSQLNYFALRPVQVEATGSTVLWLASKLGVPFQITYTYGSINIVSMLGGTVSLIGDGLSALGVVYTLWKQWHRDMDIVQASITLLLLFIATGKVFSPQYLMWVIPLLAYSGACDLFWLLCWGTLSALTTFIYIYLYSQAQNPVLIPFVPGFFQIVTLRNFLIMFVTLAYLFGWFQSRYRRPLPLLPTEKKTLDLANKERS